MCPLSLARRCGSAVLESRKVPRTLMSIIRSYFFIDTSSVFERSMAEALLTTASIPPKRSTACATAPRTSSSLRTSPTMASADPPAASICAAAVCTVPSREAWAVPVLAMIATLAPSAAARRAMARPIPRLPPLIRMVLPFSGRALAAMVSRRGSLM